MHVPGLTFEQNRRDFLKTLAALANAMRVTSLADLSVNERTRQLSKLNDIAFKHWHFHDRAETLQDTYSAMIKYAQEPQTTQKAKEIAAYFYPDIDSWLRKIVDCEMEWVALPADQRALVIQAAVEREKKIASSDAHGIIKNFFVGRGQAQPFTPEEIAEREAQKIERLAKAPEMASKPFAEIPENLSRSQRMARWRQRIMQPEPVNEPSDREQRANTQQDSHHIASQTTNLSADFLAYIEAATPPHSIRNWLDHLLEKRRKDKASHAATIKT